jgi:hypothetical protein
VAFIQRISNDIDWGLPREFENLLQALHEGIIGRTPRATIMLRIHIGHDVRENVGFSTELDEQRSEEAAGILHSGVPKIKIETRHGG